MKKTIALLSFFAVLFVSCEGPRGPEGPAGAPGLLGQVFEVTMDFTAANGYENLIDFPSNIEVYESDIVVAYILDEVTDGVDVWEPLPQTLFVDGELVLYGFDHTYLDINFFIDGTVDPGTLDPIYTQDITMRVAIIPAEFAKTLDLKNMDEVMNALQLESVEKLY